MRSVEEVLRVVVDSEYYFESCELMCTLHHINPEVFLDVCWKESLIGRPE